MKTKEISWINYARAIGMIVIYASHCEMYYGYSIPVVFALTNPFDVSIFFFVSGYLFFRKQLSEPLLSESRTAYLREGGKKLLQNTLFRLFIPSLIFSIIEYIPSRLLRGRGLNIGDALTKTLGGGTYWFTGALIIAQLLLFVLLLTRAKNIWFYFSCSVVLCVLGILLVNADHFPVPNYWSYKQGLQCMIFIALGGVYWKYEDILDTVLRKKIVLIPLTAVYTGLLLAFSNRFDVILTAGPYNFPGILISTAGVLLLTEFCKIPDKDLRRLNDIGKNTIGMYFMSGAWPIVMSMLVRRIMGVNLAGWVIVYIASFLLAYVTMKFILRYLPFMFDLRKIKKT